MKFISLLGIVALIGVAWLLSEHKRRFPFRAVMWGLTLQFFFGWFILEIWEELTQKLLNNEPPIAEAHLRLQSIDPAQQICTELEGDAPLVGSALPHAQVLMPTEVIGPSENSSAVVGPEPLVDSDPSGSGSSALA
ncbi:MAG: Na+ dependent nucleoside transporter N-terminus [Cyanobacteriota bacterium]